MRPLSASEIRASMVNLSRTKAAAMTVPPVDEVDWDNRDFLGWRDAKAPLRAYLVTDHDARLVGVSLRVPGVKGRSSSAVCNLCHSAQPGDAVLLFSANKVGRAGDSVGTYICADLACSLYLRGLLPLEVRYGQSTPLEERVAGLRERVAAFVGAVLARP
jgi:hypothetical protein